MESYLIKKISIAYSCSLFSLSLALFLMVAITCHAAADPRLMKAMAQKKKAAEAAAQKPSEPVYEPRVLVSGSATESSTNPAPAENTASTAPPTIKPEEERSFLITLGQHIKNDTIDEKLNSIVFKMDHTKPMDEGDCNFLRMLGKNINSPVVSELLNQIADRHTPH